MQGEEQTKCASDLKEASKRLGLKDNNFRPKYASQGGEVDWNKQLAKRKRLGG